MATIAVGDIHGNLRALTDILEQLRAHLGSGDTVVFLGDYIDRGRESKGCIDALLKFRGEAAADVVCLMGNHEDWFLRTLRDYRRHSWLLSMEGFSTIESYSLEAARTIRDACEQSAMALYLERSALPYEAFFDSVPADHRHFFEDLRIYHQTGDCVCSHGGVDPRVASVLEQRRDAFIWGAGRFPDGYEGADVLVYGHHNNAKLDERGWPMPASNGQAIGIDTIAHGVLTAIRLPDRQLFQSARYV